MCVYFRVLIDVVKDRTGGDIAQVTGGRRRVGGMEWIVFDLMYAEGCCCVNGCDNESSGNKCCSTMVSLEG